MRDQSACVVEFVAEQRAQRQGAMLISTSTMAFVSPPSSASHPTASGGHGRPPLAAFAPSPTASCAAAGGGIGMMMQQIMRSSSGAPLMQGLLSQRFKALGSSSSDCDGDIPEVCKASADATTDTTLEGRARTDGANKRRGFDSRARAAEAIRQQAAAAASSPKRNAPSSKGSASKARARDMDRWEGVIAALQGGEVEATVADEGEAETLSGFGDDESALATAAAAATLSSTNPLPTITTTTNSMQQQQQPQQQSSSSENHLVELSRLAEARDAVARTRAAGMALPTHAAIDSLILAYCAAGEPGQAAVLLRDAMQHGPTPTAAWYETVLGAWWRAGDTEGALGLFGEARAAGAELSTYCYGIAMQAFLQSGDAGAAAEVFEEMRRDGPEPDVACYR